MDIEPSAQSMHQRCDIVKWKDFLLSHALYILAARPNTGSTRPYIPRVEKLVHEFEEEEDDDECYQQKMIYLVYSQESSVLMFLFFFATSTVEVYPAGSVRVTEPFS